MKKVCVDESKCIGCGACVAIAPENFDFNEEGYSIVINDNPNEKVLCPICGEELLFETVGTSSKISCKNRDHVDVAIRGI